MKNRPKRRIMIIGILMFGTFLFSQMVVSDPTNDLANEQQLAQLVKQIEEAKEQTSKLSEMKNDLKKNLEFLQNVNSNIQNVERVKRIAEKQANIYNSCFRIKKKFGKSPFPEVILKAEKSTNVILESVKSDISELSKILNSGFFNMTDGERLNSIRNYEEESNKKLSQLRLTEKFVSDYENALEIYDGLLKSKE
jgi:septal ring factor EnvC (AmiA/AmiB activator)